jgi:hypothetical protein
MDDFSGIHLLIDAWPITVALIGLIATVAVMFYRVKTHDAVLFSPSGEVLYCSKKEANIIKESVMETLAKGEVRLQADEELYMKISDHKLICDAARLSQTAAIRDMRDEMSDVFAKQLDRLAAQLDKQLARNSDLILSALKQTVTKPSTDRDN